MSLFKRHTNYTVLVGYMEHYGRLPEDAEQIKAALENTEQLVNYSIEKMDVGIDFDSGAAISKVGLQWIDYAKTHPDNPQGYAATAKDILEN